MNIQQRDSFLILCNIHGVHKRSEYHVLRLPRYALLAGFFFYISCFSLL